MLGHWALRVSRMVDMARRRSAASLSDCEEVLRFGHPVPYPATRLRRATARRA